MKELFVSLDKVRWHNRYEKIPSLNKSLRDSLANKETMKAFENFVTIEKSLKQYNNDFTLDIEYDKDQLCRISQIFKSLDEIAIPQNGLTDACLKIDRELDVIKCNYFLKKFDKIVDTLKIISNVPPNGSISENINKFSRYTWRLLAECLLYYCSSLYIKQISGDSLSRTLGLSCLAIEILFELAKHQESVIFKRVKTSPEIYAEIIHLLFCAVDLNAKFSLKQKDFSVKSHIFSLQALMCSINLSLVYKYDFEVPAYKLIISLMMINWFYFACNAEDNSQSVYQFSTGLSPIIRASSTSSTCPYNELINICLQVIDKVNTNVDFNASEFIMYQHNIEYCLDVMSSILSQTKQHTIISAYTLKFLPAYFETPQQYCKLACSLYTSNRYTYCLQCCFRTLEHDSTHLTTRYLLLDVLINIFENFALAIEQATNFIDNGSKDGSFYLCRAISYLEKSIDSMSVSESEEFLLLSRADALKAIESDPNDHEAYFYAALVFAMMDNVDTALIHCFESTRKALFDSRPYHLMFILLLSKRLYDEAEKILTDLENEYPLDFHILLSRIDFELEVYGPDFALNTVKYALEIWFSVFNLPDSELFNGTTGKKRNNLPHNESPFKTPIKPSSDVLSSSITPSFSFITEGLKLNKSYSKISVISAHDTRDAIMLLLNLLFKYCQIYFELEDMVVVRKILSDIALIDFTCPEILLLSAKYHRNIGEEEKCKQLIESALFMDPNNFDALYAITEHYFEDYLKKKRETSESKIIPRHYLTLTEEHARRLVKNSPKNFISWKFLGKVLHEIGNFDESCYCLNRALDLEKIANIVPYKNVFRRFRPSDLYHQCN